MASQAINPFVPNVAGVAVAMMVEILERRCDGDLTEQDFRTSRDTPMKYPRRARRRKNVGLEKTGDIQEALRERQSAGQKPLVPAQKAVVSVFSWARA